MSQAKSRTLARGNYLILSRPLMRFVKNTDAAVILSILIDKENSLFESNLLGTGGWFYTTKEQLAAEVFLSEVTILKAEKLLVKLDLISTVRMNIQDSYGATCRKHYKINYDVLDTVLFGEESQVEALDIRSKKSTDPDSLLFCGNNNKQINNKTNNQSKSKNKDADRNEISIILQQLINLDSSNTTATPGLEIANSVFSDYEKRNKNKFLGYYKSIYQHAQRDITSLTKGECDFILSFSKNISNLLSDKKKLNQITES